MLAICTVYLTLLFLVLYLHSCNKQTNLTLWKTHQNPVVVMQNTSISDQQSNTRANTKVRSTSDLCTSFITEPILLRLQWLRWYELNVCIIHIRPLGAVPSEGKYSKCYANNEWRLSKRQISQHFFKPIKYQNQVMLTLLIIYG